MKKIINNILKSTGYQIKPERFLDRDMKRRIKTMRHLNIDLVLDVGANKGNYIKFMRDFGYTGRAISFEPLTNVFEILKQKTSKDSKWDAYDYALGNDDTSSIINIAGNMDSSSILNMLDVQVENAPETKYIGQQPITIKKLDSVFDTLCSSKDNVMLKIDTQGYEESVLRGAEKSLKKIKMIQLEMSIIPLYESEMLYMDMINFLDTQNFCLYGFENGFSNRETGRQLQVDGLFVNKDFAS